MKHNYIQKIYDSEPWRGSQYKGWMVEGLDWLCDNHDFVVWEAGGFGEMFSQIACISGNYFTATAGLFPNKPLPYDAVDWFGYSRDYVTHAFQSGHKEFAPTLMFLYFHNNIMCQLYKGTQPDLNYVTKKRIALGMHPSQFLVEKPIGEFIDYWKSVFPKSRFILMDYMKSHDGLKFRRLNQCTSVKFPNQFDTNGLIKMIKLDLKESVECRIQDADWDYKLDIGKFNTANGFYNETVDLITPTEDGKKHIESIVKRKQTNIKNYLDDNNIDVEKLHRLIEELPVGKELEDAIISINLDLSNYETMLG